MTIDISQGDPDTCMILDILNACNICRVPFLCRFLEGEIGDPFSIYTTRSGLFYKNSNSDDDNTQ